MYIYKIHEKMNDAYENHQALKEMFPIGRHLWKLIGDGLLVLSENKIIDEAEELDFIDCLGKLEDKKFLHSRTTCSIRLNPTKRNSSRKRIGLIGDDVIRYVDRKFENVDEFGFGFTSRMIKDEGRVISNRRGAKVTHRSILIRGVINIFDEDKFKKTMMTGIGSAKGFGFGLIDIWH